MSRTDFTFTDEERAAADVQILCVITTQRAELLRSGHQWITVITPLSEREFWLFAERLKLAAIRGPGRTYLPEEIGDELPDFDPYYTGAARKEANCSPWAKVQAWGISLSPPLRRPDDLVLLKEGEW